MDDEDDMYGRDDRTRNSDRDRDDRDERPDRDRDGRSTRDDLDERPDRDRDGRSFRDDRDERPDRDRDGRSFRSDLDGRPEGDRDGRSYQDDSGEMPDRYRKDGEVAYDPDDPDGRDDRYDHDDRDWGDGPDGGSDLSGDGGRGPLDGDGDDAPPEGGAPPGFAPPPDGPGGKGGGGKKLPGLLAGLRRPRFLIPLLALVLLPLGYYLYQTLHVQPRAEKERAFQVLTGALLRHVRAEENAAPPPPASLTLPAPDMTEETALLKAGAASFARGDFPAARESFARLHALRPSRETLALLAAANLRESNFSLAREHFQQLADPPFADKELAGSVGLGLALALFNLSDLEGALPHAEAAYSERLARLGPASRETASAGNILGVLLIGLNRFPEAETILENTVRTALADGRPPATAHAVADALNILALSYSLSGSGKDVVDLLPPKLAELAGPGRPPGQARDGTAGAQLAAARAGDSRAGAAESRDGTAGTGAAGTAGARDDRAGGEGEGEGEGPDAHARDGEAGTAGSAAGDGEAAGTGTSGALDGDGGGTGTSGTRPGSPGTGDADGSLSVDAGDLSGAGTADGTAATGPADGASEAAPESAGRAGPGTSGQDGGGRAALSEADYPEMLAVLNELSREHPRSPLRPALLEAMAATLTPGADGPPCQDPGDTPARESLWSLCVSLADALVSDGEFDRGFAVTGDLLNWPEAQSAPGRHQVFRNAALQNSRQDELAGSEEFLRLALAAAASREALDPQDVSFIIIRSMTLADTLLRQGKPPLEAEIELTATITLLERKLSRGALDAYPESPFMFWYLARVLRDQGRTGDARRSFDRAVRAASSAAEAHPDMASELTRLGDLVRADRSWRRGRRASEPPPFPRSPRIFFDAEGQYAARPAPSPSPAAMRLELRARKILGTLPEFEAEIDRAIAAAGPGTPERLRYQSLRLKFLEETRDWARLFAELELMTTDPPLEDPRARAMFLSSARSYEARMRMASGDPRGALDAYEKAAALLSGVPDTDEARADIATEIAKLRPGLSPASAGTPAAAGALGLQSEGDGADASADSGDGDKAGAGD
jgi:tetratricopeptide (TPR) repeat protein